MIMFIKEDIEEAKERMKAWWDHEIIDRPVISYHIPEGANSAKALIASTPLCYDLGKDLDGIDKILDIIEENSDGLISGGECIPSYFPNFGPGVIAAVFGASVEYKSGTIWFHGPTDVKDIVSVLESTKLNDKNEWYVRLKRSTEIAARRGVKGNYHVAMTDLGGILDILVSFIGPYKLIVQMKRNPGLIDTCRAIIMEKYLKIYDELQDIINKYAEGCNTWLNVWCPKRYYTMQCDVSVMLSPKFFKRFVLPDLIEQAEHMDYSFYHLDGPEQIIHLDEILKHVTAIQWVPGSKPGVPQDGTDEWMPLYKKIQKAGKNIMMYVLDPKRVPSVYKKLDPKGLFVYTVYLSKAIAACYLPKFMGGNGGELIENFTSWANEKNVKKISRALLREYIATNNIEINKELESQIFKESKKSVTEIKYL